jgi:hypothetical protein
VLTYFQGGLIGIDGNGDFYDIKTDFQGQVTVTLMMRNPLEGRRRDYAGL